MSIVDAVQETGKDSRAPPFSKKEAPLPETFISSVPARLFFFLLLVLDLTWWALALLRLAFFAALQIVSLFSSSAGRQGLERALIAIKRSSAVAVSAAVAVFAPSFGLMIGCTYFLVYDKKGPEEMLPFSLKEQFSRLLASKGSSEKNRSSDS